MLGQLRSLILHVLLVLWDCDYVSEISVWVCSLVNMSC